MNDEHDYVDGSLTVEEIKKQAAQEENERLALVMSRDYAYSTFRGAEVAKIIRARRVE